MYIIYYNIFSPHDDYTTGTWQVRVKHRNQCHYVGVFHTALLGALAADWKVRQLGWPRRLLNFPHATPAGGLSAPPAPAAKGQISFQPGPAGKNRLGFKGVFAKKKTTSGGVRYRAQVWMGGKAHAVKGSYADAESAAKARDRKAVFMGRGAAFLNFPEDFAALKEEADAYDSSDDEVEEAARGKGRASEKAARKKAARKKAARKKAIAEIPQDSSEEDEDEEDDVEDESALSVVSHVGVV